MSTADRRADLRLLLGATVEVHCPDGVIRTARTVDLSQGGLLLQMSADERPALDTPVQVQVQGTLGDGTTPPRVPARVLRHTSDGLAIRYEVHDPNRPTET